MRRTSDQKERSVKPIDLLQLLTSFVLVCLVLMWLLNLWQRKKKLALEPALSAEKPAFSFRRKSKEVAEEKAAAEADAPVPLMRRRQIVPPMETVDTGDGASPEPSGAVAATEDGPSRGDIDWSDAEPDQKQSSDQIDAEPDNFVQPKEVVKAPETSWETAETAEAAETPDELRNHGSIDNEESIAVILRRPVMPDADAPVRSWLGGLPEMPDDVEWPQALSAEDPSLGKVPHHFLAQISCADLPQELWGGRGPREGSLLFFVDPNVGCPDDDTSHTVLHITGAGKERPAPDTLGPVHNKVYTGGSYNWLPIENVPPVWRKWPVEICETPNVLHDIDGHPSATPAGFSSILYDGAPVTDRVNGTVTTPYTYGQSANALRQLAARMRNEPREVASTQALNMVVENRAINRLLESLQHARAKIDTQDNPDLRARQLEDLLPRLALVTEVSSARELVELLNRERSKVAKWRAGIAKHCVNLEKLLAGESDDTPLPQENWEELQQCFVGQSATMFELGIDYNHADGKALTLTTIRETAELEAADGLSQLAILDSLDAERSALVPDAVKEAIKPALRNLYANRPHRMGGYHDGVQTTVSERADEQVLLLQIATDEAMDWCWGDAGAYYFWIDKSDLANGDFSKVSMTLECC